MSLINLCALCKSHADQEYHSTYKGYPINVGISWITKKRHYHSNWWEAKTLAGIKAIISESVDPDRAVTRNRRHTN